MKNVFKKIICLTFVITLTMLLFGCSVKVSNEEMSIEFEDGDIVLSVGDSYTLKPIVTGVNDPDVIYTVGDQTILSRDNNVITGLKEGTTTVEAKVDGVDLSIVLNVTVKKKQIVDSSLDGYYYDSTNTYFLLENDTITILKVKYDLLLDENNKVYFSLLDGSKMYMEFKDDGTCVATSSDNSTNNFTKGDTPEAIKNLEGSKDGTYVYSEGEVSEEITLNKDKITKDNVQHEIMISESGNYYYTIVENNVIKQIVLIKFNADNTIGLSFDGGKTYTAYTKK